MLVLTRDTTPQFVPSSVPVAPALGRAFDAACRQCGEDAERVLRDATIALVERLKSKAVPPERVVVAIKAALAKYGNVHIPPSLAAEPEDAGGARRAEVYRRVFGWYLDAYFNDARGAVGA